MKTHPTTLIITSMILLASSPRTRAEDAVRVRVERSNSLSGPWQKIPLDNAPTDANGDPIIPDPRGSSFFRAVIDKIPGGAGESVPFGSLSRVLISEAARELESGKGDQEDGWPDDAVIDPIVHPIYDLAFEDGKLPAFYELKVELPDRPTPKGPLLRNESAGCPSRDLGYILLSMSRGEPPMPARATTGQTPVERLQCAAGDKNIRVLRFGPTLLMAEDMDGKLVANLGAHPFRPNPTLAEDMRQPVEWSKGEDDAEGRVSRPPPPAYGGPYESYEDFKKDYVDNPVYQQIRARRAFYAAPQWEAIRGTLPEGITLHVGDNIVLLDGKHFESWSLDEEDTSTGEVPHVPIVSLYPRPDGGLLVNAFAAGEGWLQLELVTGEIIHQPILVLPRDAVIPRISPKGPTTYPHWRVAAEYYAGTYAIQPKYNQMIGTDYWTVDWNGYDGCGPTAWAIYFGWLERNNGVKAAFDPKFPLPDTVTAPSEYLAGQYYNGVALRPVYSILSDLCDTINVPFSDQTATMPGDEAEGGLDYLWFSELGGRIKRSWHMKWAGLFGTLDTPDEGGAKYGRDAIKAGFPSVTGLGEYWHYVVAYGYKSEALDLAPNVPSGVVRRQIRCNMGWGPNAPAEWRDFYDVFFTSNYKIWNGPNAN